MKIVFVNPVGALGGAERVLLTVLAALRTAQPNLQLHLIAGTNGLLVERAQNQGVQVLVLKLPEKLNQLGDSALKGNSRATAILALLWRSGTILPALWQYQGEFRRVLRDLDPDLIHSNGIKTHLLRALAGSMGVPVVWHIHDFYGSRPLMARALRWASSSAAAGIAISEAVARDARATLPHLPIEVIYNAIDVSYFSPRLPHLEDKEMGRVAEGETTGQQTNGPMQNRDIRVGLVATFARWKGHDVFLDAAAHLLRERPDLNVRFCIVGGPIYKTQGSQFSERELRDRASALQIGDKVDFLGFQENIADVYRWLDIAVHASTQPEPFGLAIVEAIACGKPVIVSQAGGAAELFTDNFDAIGVEPGKPAALSSAIQHLIDHPSERQRLSENARETVLKRFSHDRLGQQILAVYRRFHGDTPNCITEGCTGARVGGGGFSG